MSDQKLGTVTHFYDKINVAIVDVESDINIGDKIKFVRGGEELFEQSVDSMQIEHEEIQNSKKGEVIGLKTADTVKEGAEIFAV